MKTVSSPPFNYVVVTLIIALIVFSPPIIKWAIGQGYIKIGPPTGPLAHPYARVWADRQTGYYYCQDSRQFGRTQGGTYLSQAEAVQQGYRPAVEDPCR